MASTPEQVVCTPTFVFPAAFPETYGKLLIAEASSCYGFDPRQHLANFHGPPPTAAQQVTPPTSSPQEQPGGTKPSVSKALTSPRSSLASIKIPQPPVPPSSSADYTRCLTSAPVAFPGIDPTKLPKIEHPPEQPKNDKLWPCPSCKVPFKAASELQQHLGQHTRGEQRSGGNVPSVPCEVCGKLFATVDRVRAHVRAAHGEKACACDICGSGFSYRCKLLDHMRTHTGDKPFRCDVCGKTFSQKNHLTRHAMIHTGERPFPCDFCGRGFYRKDKLARHRRVHTVGSNRHQPHSGSSLPPEQAVLSSSQASTSDSKAAGTAPLPQPPQSSHQSPPPPQPSTSSLLSQHGLPTFRNVPPSTFKLDWGVAPPPPPHRH